MYIRNPPPGTLDQSGCLKARNDIAVEFNKQLKQAVMELRTQLPQAALTYDLYGARHGLISHDKEQGFVDPLVRCCGARVNDYNV
ncbi:GDSL esterase/lipase [Vitis vinifera]